MFSTFLILSMLAFILCLIAVPVWLYLTYKNKQNMSLGLSPEEKQQLQYLEEEAKALHKRVSELEALLDYHQPNWRNSH